MWMMVAAQTTSRDDVKSYAHIWLGGIFSLLLLRDNQQSIIMMFFHNAYKSRVYQTLLWSAQLSRRAWMSFFYAT